MKYYHFSNKASKCPLCVWTSIQAVDVEAVAVTVKELVSYALTLNPNNQSWLITQADIYFGESRPAAFVPVGTPAVRRVSLYFTSQFPWSLLSLCFQWPISTLLLWTFTSRPEPCAQTSSPKRWPPTSTRTRYTQKHYSDFHYEQLDHFEQINSDFKMIITILQHNTLSLIKLQ